MSIKPQSDKDNNGDDDGDFGEGWLRMPLSTPCHTQTFGAVGVHSR